MDGGDDVNSECEFVERCVAQLHRRAGAEDITLALNALRHYSDNLKRQTAIRDLRLLHQNNLKTINHKIQILNEVVQKLAGTYLADKAHPSELSIALAHPHSNKETLRLFARIRNRSLSDLRKELQDALNERELETQTYERQLQDLHYSLTSIAPGEMTTVRGFLAQRKSSKKMRRRQEAAQSQKGDLVAQAKRAENSVFTAFFDKHQFHTFLQLRHGDVIDLVVIFEQADANNSGAVEEDDFSKLIRRLFCEYGITQAEVDRIALLCGLSIADGFTLSLGPFFTACVLLQPLIEKKCDEFLLIEDETNEQLRSRQHQSLKDETELYHIEREAIKTMNAIRQDTSKTPAEQDDALLTEFLALEAKRMEWANKAVILSVKELDRIRLQAIVNQSKQLAAAASAETAGAQRRSQSASTPRGRTARAEGSGEPRADVQQVSTVQILETFKNSVRNALHRAPFVDVQSADDIPNEDVELAFYQLFHVLSKQEDFITPDHIHFLLDIFTPCGADADEAKMFLSEECDGAETIVFDEFVKYGSNLKQRLLAFETFMELPSNKARREAIEERVQPRGKRKEALPLRRYEKEFLRNEEARKAVNELKQKNLQKTYPGPKPPSSPRRLLITESSAKSGRRPKTAGDAVVSNNNKSCLGGTSPSKAAKLECAAPDWEPQRISPVDENTSPTRDRNALIVSPEHNDGNTDSAPRNNRLRKKAWSSSSLHQRIPLPKFVEKREVLPELHGHRQKQDDALVYALRQQLLK